MEISEIPPLTTGSSEVGRTKEGEGLENMQKPKPGSNSRPKRNRTRSDKKEGRKEITGTSVEDPTCKDLYLEILKDLKSEHFIVEADVKLEGSPFFCELCEVKLENIEKCQDHVRSKQHKKLKKTKGERLTLSRVCPPSEAQLLALNRLLESVVLEHGLCPLKDLPRRQEVAKDVSRTVCSTHPECLVSVYGSSFTGFGLKESDVNLDLVIPDGISVPHVLLTILDLLQSDEQYCDVKSDFDAKVPRILFKHVSSGLDCELSPGNGTASSTSRLLKMYSDLDPCVRILVAGLRYWARLCSVDCQSEGGLPGYSLALMVIQFLQETKPPVLPRWTPTEVVDKDKPCSMKDFVSENKDEVGSLWFQLFRFYCLDFDLPSLVISIKEPMPLERETKKWGHRRIAVEDPFSSKRNVASSMSSDKAFEYFFSCWKNSFFYFGSFPTCPQNKPIADVPNSISNTCMKKNDKANQDADVIIEEETIFEMDDLEQAAKQLQSLEMPSNDGFKAMGVSERPTEENAPNLKSKAGGNDTDDEVEITFSESEDDEGSKSTNQVAEDKERHEDSGKQGCLMTEAVNKTNVVNSPDFEYRFDAKVFMGKSRPVKTCCYCKDDGHTKAQCPDLRKPSLRPLPPVTQQFVDVLDFACNKCRADFEFDQSEVGYRETVLRNLEEYIHAKYPGAKLFLFGSSKNGFGFRNSDIDICMTLDDMAKEEVDAVEVITELAKLLKKHKDCGNVLAITTAKVPIVKFYLRSCKREADISLYNTLALENTAMLATYAKLDERVATLGYTVKVFAKVCDIGDASKGSLSSYAYILMLLHYLQQCNPPVIPVLQDLYTDKKKPEKIIEGWNCWFCKDLKNIKSLWDQKQKHRNLFSAGLLWYGFLRYYTEQFDFEHDVVCCRRTKKLTKFEKMWTKHVFAIEDPFNLDHNLGAGVTRKMASYIMSTFIRGRERFGFPRYDIPPQHCQQYFFDVYFLTDGYEAPTDRNCRVCGRIGHIAKDCPYSKSNKRAEQKKEEEERKVARENGQKTDVGMKPFNVGPSRPRSVSAPNKQEQRKGIESGASLPASQQNKIASHQEASVKDTNASALPVTQKHDVKRTEVVAENSSGTSPSAMSLAQNPQTGLPDKAVSVTGVESELIDPNRTRMQQSIPMASPADVATKTATQAGDSISQQVDLKEHQTNAASSPTMQISSSVPRPHSQSAPTVPNHPLLGLTQAPHPISPGSTRGLVGSMSPQTSKSPPERQSVMLSTPPRHQPFMFSPQGGHFVGSPSQHEMWLRQYGVTALNQSSVRPLVPYPVTPETPSPLHHYGIASDRLTGQYLGSPIRGQQHLTEHNEQLVSTSPPNIARHVIWPVGRFSPPSAVRGQLFPGQQLQFPVTSTPGAPAAAKGSPQPQRMNHPHMPYASSPSVPASPQQTAPHFHMAHSPGVPSPVYGSPSKHALQHPMPHQEGRAQPTFGAHMTGEQFISWIKRIEDETKRQGSATKTKVSSDDFEPKDVKKITSKELKVAETPEEHKLLSNLSKVKSLWEECPSLGPERNCPNTDPTVNGPLYEENDVRTSATEALSLTKREAWGPCPDMHEESDETKSVDEDHKEAKEAASYTEKSVHSSLSDERVTTDEFVAPDEKLQAMGASPTSNKTYQTNVYQQTTGATPEELPKQKPTRRGGRRRKGKKSRHSESDTNGVEMLDETGPEGEQTARNGNTQNGYDDGKFVVSNTETSPKKARSGGGNEEQQNVVGGSESRAHQSNKKKNSPSSAKNKEKVQPERSQQETRTVDRNNSPRQSTEGVKKVAPNQKNVASAIDGDNKRPPQGSQTLDSGDSSKSPSKGGKGGSPKEKNSPTSAKDAGKRGTEESPQGVRTRDSGDFPESPSKGGKGGSPKEKNSPTSAKDAGKRGTERSPQGSRTLDSGDSSENRSKGGKGGSPKEKNSPTSAKDAGKSGTEGSPQGVPTRDSGDSPRSPSKGGKGGSPKQKNSPTSAKDGIKKGTEMSPQGRRTSNSGISYGGFSKGGKGGASEERNTSRGTKGAGRKETEGSQVLTVVAGDSTVNFSKGGKGGTPKEKNSPTNANDAGKRVTEESPQGVRTADSGDSCSGKGGKGESSKHKSSPKGTKDGYKNGSEGSSQSLGSADSRYPHGRSRKELDDGASKQKGSPASTKDEDKKRSKESWQGARTGDSVDSCRRSSVESKGESPKQKDSSASTNVRDNKRPEGRQQFERTGNLGNSPKDSGKGGKGGASNRWRRRRHSRTTSEGKGGEKKDYRRRSNSAPDKHPKNS